MSDYLMAMETIDAYQKGNVSLNEFESHLLPLLTSWNDAYRADTDDVVTDFQYDAVWHEFRSALPNHEFVTQIEPEVDESSWRKTVIHKIPMLSIDKAVGDKGTNGWLNRVRKAEAEAGVQATIRVTAKKDGNAAYLDRGVLSTRGRDGRKGYDISHLIPMGLKFDGEDGLGEVVITKAYFNDHLKPHEDSKKALTGRNVTTALCNSIDPRQPFQDAINKGAVHFSRYEKLSGWRGSIDLYQEHQEMISDKLQKDSIHPTDGVVAEVLEPEIRAILGSTNSFNGWNFARKDVGERGLTVVQSITWQVGRTGTVTPVLNVKPIKVSGCVISNITSHNASRLNDDQIGVGAEIEVIRSGLVIPKVHKVIKGANPEMPSECPCCDGELEFDDVRLICTDVLCEAQLGRTLEHFSSALDIKHLGGKRCDTLAKSGVSPMSLLDMDQASLIQAGISKGVALNVHKEMQRVTAEPMEDWRILGAFGFPHLGRGDSKKILAEYSLDSVSSLTSEEIQSIKGFATIKSLSVSRSLHANASFIHHVTSKFSNIIEDSKLKVGNLSGKSFVFTGTLTKPRSEIQNLARSLGAIVQSSVTGKTDFLVMGKNTGAKKIEAAEKKGVQCIDEYEFHEMMDHTIEPVIQDQLSM